MNRFRFALLATAALGLVSVGQASDTAARDSAMGTKGRLRVAPAVLSTATSGSLKTAELRGPADVRVQTVAYPYRYYAGYRGYYPRQYYGGGYYTPYSYGYRPYGYRPYYYGNYGYSGAPYYYAPRPVYSYYGGYYSRPSFSVQIGNPGYYGGGYYW